MTTLDLTTIQVDDFSLIELTKREGGGFNLTLHVGDEESSRWDDLSVGLSTAKSAQLAEALSSLPEQAVGVSDVWERCAGMAHHSAELCEEAGRSEVAEELYVLEHDIRYAASKSPPSQPAAVEVTDEMVEPGMVRVCPERDARCPHGMNCPFGVGEHWHTCDMAASRAALRSTP